MSLSSAVVQEPSPVERDPLASIVVMDDDDEYAAEISEKIVLAGYVPQRAAGASECLSLAEDGHRNFFLDLSMGRGRDREGLNALQQLREFEEIVHTGPIYCVLISNHLDHDVQVQAEKLLLDASVCKPVASVAPLIAHMELTHRSMSHLPASPRGGSTLREQLRSSAAPSPRPLGDLPGYRRLVARYQNLTDASVRGIIAEDEKGELIEVERALRAMESEEAARRRAARSATAARFDATVAEIRDLVRDFIAGAEKRAARG